jgi:hypothetical protein
MGLILAPLEYTVGDQLGEALGEDVAGDPEAAVKVVEPANAVEGVPQDENRPAIADDFHCPGNGTMHLREVFPRH